MIRISVSMLDQFVKYYTDKLNELQLIERITKPFISTVSMERGTAFHSIIENPNKYLIGNKYICDGFEFDYLDIQEALNYVPEISTYEVSKQKIYEIDGETIQLRGRVDILSGLSICDLKATFAYFNRSWYEDAYQWRCYLDIFDLDKFEYLVFLFDDDNRLKEKHRINLYRYPDMDHDIMEELSKALYFIKAKNLENYFMNKD